VPQPQPSGQSGPTAPYGSATSPTLSTDPSLPRGWQPDESGVVLSEPKPWLAGELGAPDDFAKVPGKFVAFLKISAKRAFRLRIDPSEVLPIEREELEAATPPIVDANLQAFLAWRRSVLFLVATSLVFLTLLGLINGMAVSMPGPVRFVKLTPAIAEGVFAYICWWQLRHWAHWRSQRRKLMIGWVLFMATPFVVMIYPLRTVFDNSHVNASDLVALGFDGVYNRTVLPFQMSMLAMLQLAPKAISLMPGLVRASLVIKLLFPGSPAPGWLMVVAAPLYALLAYVILIVPYQFTGSGWFVAGIIGIVAGQFLLARAGFALAQPLTEAEAVAAIKKVRKLYVSIMVGSAILIVIALGSLVSMLKLHAFDVITAILKFETNILILTMIGADVVITNLDRARAKNAGRDHHEEQAELKIAAFVSLDAPHVPPPSGPAPGWGDPHS
jgi:hypothetical protein